MPRHFHHVRQYANILDDAKRSAAQSDIRLVDGFIEFEQSDLEPYNLVTVFDETKPTALVEITEIVIEADGTVGPVAPVVHVHTSSEVESDFLAVSADSLVAAI